LERAVGMLVVETIGGIRREHFTKGKSIKEIARDLKILRNTVRPNFSPSSDEVKTFVHRVTLLPGHFFQGILLSRKKAQLCNPCPRNELSPIS
jgi:hypothetical protein